MSHRRGIPPNPAPSPPRRPGSEVLHTDDEHPKRMGLRRRRGEQREPVSMLELLDFLVNTDPYKVGCKICRDARPGPHADGCELVEWRDRLARPPPSDRPVILDRARAKPPRFPLNVLVRGRHGGRKIRCSLCRKRVHEPRAVGPWAVCGGCVQQLLEVLG